ncbi:MAG: exo-alpha-sialidase [Clostridia bacterium]|nr:exo-alpha-sialidase [Clostridia bacterium]
MLKNIYAPTVVGVQPGDSRNGICVMPDGEIRHYGEREKKHPWDKGDACYISSCDGGLSWKYHECGNNVMGSCEYIPELGKYFALTSNVVITKNDSNYQEPTKGTFLKISKTGADDTDYELIKVSDNAYFDPFLPKYIKSKNRITVTAQWVHDGEYNPVFIYSDDGGATWKTSVLESVPKFEVIFPSVSPRWENNGAEPVFCECPDGRLMLFARTSQDYFYVYYSSDYGETWTKPVRSDFHATLTTPYFLKLSDGRTLFFWNNNQPLPEINQANELPKHEDGFAYVGEDVFTNRDVSHVAISDDCVNWEGFRELYLNGIRNNPDFRTIGGLKSSADKSVHQFQAIELPFGKVLVAVGQNTVSRKLVIFDPDWLYAKERSEDFREGMTNVTTHMYVKSLSGDYVQDGHPGHCSWNRTNGALLVPNPDMDGTEVLQICRIPDPRLFSQKQGVVWNFPKMKKGMVRIGMRVEGEGVKIALCDRWFNTIDEYVGEQSPFSFRLTPDTMLKNTWHEIGIEFDFDSKMAYVYRDSKKLFGVRMKFVPDHGISYIHLQTDAEVADYEGTLIKSFYAKEIE